MGNVPLLFLNPLCLLSDEQKQVTILVRQKQLGRYRRPIFGQIAETDQKVVRSVT